MKVNYSKLYRDYYYKNNNLNPIKESIGISLGGMLSIVIVLMAIVLMIRVAYAKLNKPEVRESKAEIIIIDTEHITQEEIKEAQARCNDWLKRENELAPQQEYKERCRELNANFQIGDWIKITWWGDLENGPDAPTDASCTGQIKRITGDTISGSWGDYKLQYKKAYWQRIKKSEYLELREKEQRRRDRQNRKKNYGLWGVRMPGSYSENTKERVWWDNPEVYAREKKK